MSRNDNGVGEHDEKFCPTDDYVEGKPNGKCWGCRHYLCKECVYLDPEYISDEAFENAMIGQGLIQFTVYGKKES